MCRSDRGNSRQDWGEASKSELYDQAQRLGIAGRSKMSKSELMEALQRAS